MNSIEIRNRYKEKDIISYMLEKKFIDVNINDENKEVVINIFSDKKVFQNDFYLSFEDGCVYIGEKKDDPKNLTPVSDLLNLLENSKKEKTFNYMFELSEDDYSSLKDAYYSNYCIDIINVIFTDESLIDEYFKNYIYEKLDGDDYIESYENNHGSLVDKDSIKETITDFLMNKALESGLNMTVMMNDSEFLRKNAINDQINFIKEIYKK